MNLRLNVYYILLLLLCMATIVRFINFSDRIDFSLDSSTNLIESGKIIHEHKLTLIGPPVASRVMGGQYFYLSSLYTYSLATLQLITFDPIILTALFALFNIATGLVMWLIVSKRYGFRAAHLALLFYSIDPLMVRLSHTIWNVNSSPLLILLSWLLFPNHLFIIGILSGLGTGFHTAYLAPATLLFLILIWKGKPIHFYLLGFFIGELPLVLFDLRHNFQNSRNFITYCLAILTGNSNSSVSQIDFTWLWVFLPVAIAQALLWLKRKSPTMAFCSSLLLASTALAYLFSGTSPTNPGMSQGWSINGISKAASIIAKDSSKSTHFEVASLIQGDTRDYPIRYYLEFIHKITPMNVDSYPQSELTYVIARSEVDIYKASVWELTAGGPFQIQTFWPIQKGISIYKLHYEHPSR